MDRVCEIAHVPHSCCHCRGSGVVQAVCVHGHGSLPLAMEQREDPMGVWGCARTQLPGCLLHTQGHSETSWKSTCVCAQQLDFASRDIPAACAWLEQSHGHFTVGVFMVTGAFGSLKGDKKGAEWIGCPLRLSSSTPDFGTRLSAAHQMQSWLNVK